MNDLDEDERAFDVEVDEAEFEDLPSTNIEVIHHLNFGMAGSFPLRLADIFLCKDGLYITEYGNITPLFGLVTRRHKREANVMQTIYEYHGIDEILLQSDLVMWINYANLEQVRIHDGGRFGRPKITVSTEDKASYAYRIHGEVSLRELQTSMKEITDQNEFDVNFVAGYGLRSGG
jgi:hypothetical protein